MRTRVWIVLAALAVTGLAILLGCRSTAPTVAFIAPRDGDTIAQGSITVKVLATTSNAMSRVEFYVDGVLIAADSTDEADTFRCTWNASSESLAHTIRAVAHDKAGNSAGRTITVFVRTDYPKTVRATIPTTDGHPQNLVCPCNTERVYVTGGWDNAVYVIRTSDSVIMDTLRLGNCPTFIDCSPNGQYVYIGSFDDIDSSVPRRLYSIRTSDNVIVDSVDLLGIPHGIACLPNGEYIYVSLDDPTNEVAVIRASDLSIVSNIPVGTEPRGLVALPNSQFVYVTCTYSDSVYVIRTADNTVVGRINVGSAPHGLAVLPAGDYVYVSRYDYAPIMVVRTSDNTVVDSITVSEGRPCGLTAFPNGRYVYVTNRDAGCVDIIRTSDNKVVATAGVGSTPYDAASLPDGSGVYVANRDDNSVTFIGY